MSNTEFTAYLQSKNFTPRTIINHLKYVEQFLVWAKKEEIQIIKPDVLKFLEYLKNKRKLQNSYRSFYLVAINHYFTFLYENEQIARNPCLFIKIRGTNKKRLYKIYTVEELDSLFDNYYQLFVCNYNDHHMPKNKQKQSALSKERNALILSILINQGIRTTEIDKIETNDIDFIKATLKICGGKRLNNRVLPLKATQIGLFINYLQNIRPQLLEYQEKDSNKLFLPLPNGNEKKTDTTTSIYAFYMLTNALKSIDKHFINVLQIRASVITNWLKTQGLRKAQYLAGHRYIGSTEKYVTNNLDDLIDNINKLHPLV